jgi:hypothetical protein
LKRSSLLIVLNVFAAITYLSVSWATGSLAHVDATIFGSHDSLEYRSVADWIFGSRPNVAASSWRPFLYPLLIGAAERLGGIRGVWVLNLLLWFTTLNFAFAATYHFVQSKLAAALVFLVLATNISLILLSYQALTEITVVALLAIWIYGLSRLTRRPTPSQVACVMLPVALLLVVKPEFEMLLAIVALVLGFLVIKSTAPRLAALVLVLCLLPVAIQLAINYQFNNYLGISSIGGVAFRGYFLARVDVAIGQSRDVFEARPLVNGLSNLDAARFMFDHFEKVVVVFVSTLKENLLAGSNFLGNHPRIGRLILATQAVDYVLLLLLVPLTCVALWRARDVRLALLCVATLNVLVAGGLTFWQGDRITIVALPIWVIAFVLSFKQAGGIALWKFLATRLNPKATPAVGTGLDSPDAAPAAANAAPRQ